MGESSMQVTVATTQDKLDDYSHSDFLVASKKEVLASKDGDSMHGISQKYGIRLKNLYKMNRKDGEYVPEIGDRLRLR